MSRRPRGSGGRAGRGGGRSGGGVAPPALEVPEQIPGLKAWFDSRTTAQMTFGTGNAIASWASRAGSMGPVVLSQGVAANRPLWVASESLFGNKPTVRFDGTDDMLQAATAADWIFLHNGLGSAAFMVGLIDSTGFATQIPVQTMSQASSNTGFVIASNTGNLSSQIGNGSGTAYLNTRTITTAGHFERDVARWRGATHGGGVRTFYAGGGAAVLTQADTGGQTASLASPTQALSVGGVGGSFKLKGHLPQLLLYGSELSAANMASLAAWAATEYPGVAA